MNDKQIESAINKVEKSNNLSNESYTGSLEALASIYADLNDETEEDSYRMLGNLVSNLAKDPAMLAKFQELLADTVAEIEDEDEREF